MALTIIRDSNVEIFLEKAGELLYQQEALNSLMLGLCENQTKLSLSPTPILLRVLDKDKTVSAAIQTPPMNLILSPSTNDQLDSLGWYLFDQGHDLPGVVGPSKEAETFSKIWSKMTGSHYKLGMDQKIYQIQIAKLPETQGLMKLATMKELKLIANWLFEFSHESLPLQERKTLQEIIPSAEASIKNERSYLWMVDDIPVSAAHLSRPTKNGISISAVYTPPGLRKKGYASAVVAQLSKKMLDEGKDFCVLYTDQANKTSNQIYQDVGYVEIAESRHYTWS